jgi:hypothetical protein
MMKDIKWNMAWSRFSPIAPMFSYDKNINGFGWALQIFNNLTGCEFSQNQVGQSLDIDGEIKDSGFYKERFVSRTSSGTLGSAISLGHYIYGDDIALNPWDYGHDIDLFAHEFGHTYQSRISGPMYLFRYGLASAAYGGESRTESDANIRSAQNNLPISAWRPQNSSNFKYWEFGLSPFLWPFMWSWSH